MIESVLSLISRGKGCENELSDHDLSVIVKDDVAEECKRKLEEVELLEIDLSVMSLPEFSEYAQWQATCIGKVI